MGRVRGAGFEGLVRLLGGFLEEGWLGAVEEVRSCLPGSGVGRRSNGAALGRGHGGGARRRNGGGSAGKSWIRANTPPSSEEPSNTTINEARMVGRGRRKEEGGMDGSMRMGGDERHSGR
jgi:hypothetical protein